MTDAEGAALEGFADFVEHGGVVPVDADVAAAIRSLLAEVERLRAEIETHLSDKVKLRAEVERLRDIIKEGDTLARQEVERLRAAMLRMQEDGYPQVWGYQQICCGYEEDGECLWCAAHPSPGGEGHEADCPWLVVESVKGEKR